MLIADLHIHSRYSRGCSRDLSPETLWRWSQLKGIDVVGTGDFTHPELLEARRKVAAAAKAHGIFAGTTALGSTPELLAMGYEFFGIGADIVDVNMGCPVPKVAKHDAVKIRREKRNRSGKWLRSGPLTAAAAAHSGISSPNGGWCCFRLRSSE